MRIRVLSRTVKVRPKHRQGPWIITGYGISPDGRPIYHVRAEWPNVHGPFRSLTRDRLAIYRPRSVRTTLEPTTAPEGSPMAIEKTRYRRHSQDDGAYWLDAKVTGHPRWIELGLIERKGRRWRWTCWDASPKSGREDTRAEAVTALLAHVREGDHDHISQHTEGNQ
jgi:hypothetical protein